MPIWVFQAVAFVLFLQCVFSLFIRFDVFPTLSATFTNDYGESLYYDGVSYVSGVFQACLAIFWVFVSVKGFSRRCIAGGIGALLFALNFVYYASSTFAIANAISSQVDYEAMAQLRSALYVPWPLLNCIAVLGMFLLAIKGEISRLLKVFFMLYPVISTVAYGLLSGYRWYIWFEILYALALMVLSLKSNSSDKNLNTQIS